MKGSAGACSVVGLATTFESDYKTELSTSEDPTLASTHLEQSSSIAAGLVQWGAEYVPEYAVSIPSLPCTPCFPFPDYLFLWLYFVALPSPREYFSSFIYLQYGRVNFTTSTITL